MISRTSSGSSLSDGIVAEDLWDDCAARVDPNLGNSVWENAGKLSQEVDKTQAAVTETLETYGKAILAGALEGTQAMIQGVVNQVCHPIDCLAKPVGEMLHDIGLAEGWRRTQGEIDLTGDGIAITRRDLGTGAFRDPFTAPYTEVAMRDSLPSLLADRRIDERTEALERVAESFMSATGPQRAGMIASVVAPGFLLGGLGGCVSSSRGMSRVSYTPPEFHKVVFQALEGKSAQLNCSIGKNGETLTVHVYRLSLADASIGDKTLYAGVLPLTLEKFKQLAREQGATKLVLQASFDNQRLGDVLKAKYPTHSEQPFLHKGASFEAQGHHIGSDYVNGEFVTFEVPLGKN